MDILQKAPLGKKSAMPTGYDPQLLFPIPRNLAREPLGLAAAQPFYGVDVWTAFEMGWRNPKGKPQVGIATFFHSVHHAPHDREQILQALSEQFER